MAKNSIRDYDSSSSNNSDVQSVDISEGCSPSGINNAIREVMADLADVNEGTVALESPKFDSIKDGNIKPPDASGTDVAGTATTIKGGAGTGTGAGGSIVFQTADGGSTGSSVNAHATAMTIADDGSIDINGNDLILDADGDSKIEASTDDTINIISGGTTGLKVDSSGYVTAPVNPKFSTNLATSVASADYTSGSTTPLPQDTEDFDIGNCITISSDVATFTAPVTGYYQFNLSVIFQSASGAATINTYLNVNGALTANSQDQHYRVLTDPEGAAYTTLTNSALIYVESGQTVVPHIYVATDTSVIMRDGSRFSGFLVP
jgi:hypothetical protein